MEELNNFSDSSTDSTQYSPSASSQEGGYTSENTSDDDPVELLYILKRSGGSAQGQPRENPFQTPVSKTPDGTSQNTERKDNDIAGNISLQSLEIESPTDEAVRQLDYSSPGKTPASYTTSPSQRASARTPAQTPKPFPEFNEATKKEMIAGSMEIGKSVVMNTENGEVKSYKLGQEGLFAVNKFLGEFGEDNITKFEKGILGGIISASTPNLNMSVNAQNGMLLAENARNTEWMKLGLTFVFGLIHKIKNTNLPKDQFKLPKSITITNDTDQGIRLTPVQSKILGDVSRTPKTERESKQEPLLPTTPTPKKSILGAVNSIARRFSTTGSLMPPTPVTPYSVTSRRPSVELQKTLQTPSSSPTPPAVAGKLMSNGKNVPDSHKKSDGSNGRGGK